MKTTPQQLAALLAQPKVKVVKKTVSMKEIVRRKLESDPTTIMDRSAMRERWGI